MEANQVDQIEALLLGDSYSWAVRTGRIKSGQPLHISAVFTVTRRDVVEYLRTHPVPGFDLRQATYRGSSDGPKLRKVDDAYVMGWQERGTFIEEYIAHTEAAAREFWIKFLANSLGLAA